MTTINDAWQAGIDAVVADNTLNRAGFVDALQTVLVQRFTNAEGNDWCDAVAVEFNRVGLITNSTYNRLRNDMIADPVLHRTRFEALGGTIQSFDETLPALQSARLIDLRSDRDLINDAIDRVQAIIDAEPAGPTRRLVREAIRPGKDLLRQHKQSIRDEIQNLIGDPDG